MPVYKFKDCLLNQQERRVFFNGAFLRLTPRAFELLSLLAERQGKLVSNDELLGHVWGGQIVEESNLPVQISYIRKVLTESGLPDFIENIPAQGYRLVGPVDEISDFDWEQAVKTNVGVAAGGLHWRFDSIALLPLFNEGESGDLQYLADGLTESFINQLSVEPGLSVVARNIVFRYRDPYVDPKQVGKALKVPVVLTGRVRIANDKVIVGVELNRTSNGIQIWGTIVEKKCDDLFKIRDEIFSQLLNQLRIEPVDQSSPELPSNSSNHPEAFRQFLWGRYFLGRRTSQDLYKAISSFTAAAKFDPLFASAFVQTVECYLSLFFTDILSYPNTMEKIRPYVEFVENNFSDTDDIHAMRGVLNSYMYWRFEEAASEYKMAITLNPNHILARHRYINTLVQLGQYTEAIAELRSVSKWDPLSFLSSKWLGRQFYKMGLFESALEYLREAVELEPGDFIAWAILAATLAELKEYDTAIAAVEKSLSCHHNVDTVALLHYIYALKGDRAKVDEWVRTLNSNPSDDSQPSLKLARVYAALGEPDIALKHIDDAIREHHADVADLNSDPRWNRIKDDPRFKERLKIVGLMKDR